MIAFIISVIVSNDYTHRESIQCIFLTLEQALTFWSASKTLILMICFASFHRVFPEPQNNFR